MANVHQAAIEKMYVECPLCVCLSDIKSDNICLMYVGNVLLSVYFFNAQLAPAGRCPSGRDVENACSMSVVCRLPDTKPENVCLMCVGMCASERVLCKCTAGSCWPMSIRLL